MISYRQIVEEEVAAVLECRRETWGHGERAEAEMALRGIDGAWLAEGLGDGTLAGWACCQDWRPTGYAVADRGRGEFWVTGVRPERASGGLGQELVRQAEAWLFSHGWREIRMRLDGPEPREAVAAFYAPLGWVMGEEGESLMKANPGPVFALEEHAVTDEETGYTRRVRLQRGPADRAHRVCVFLDGEHYWRDMGAVGIFNALVARGALPGMTLAFVGHVSGAARQVDYTCNERYAHFLGARVMPWLREQVPALQPGGHVIVGLSLSGLMAVYQTLRDPQYFSGCISQSGSHWWRHEWFAEMARQRGPVTARVWLSAGDGETQMKAQHAPGLEQEISQIAGVEKLTRVLAELGAEVVHRPFKGGHTLPNWSGELGAALEWVVGGAAVE